MKPKLVMLAPLLLAGTGASLPPTPAAAAAAVPAPTTAGCLLVSNIFAKHATEEKDRSLGQLLVYFFMGRIDDRTSEDRLKLDLQEQRRAINDSNATALVNACLQEMQSKAQMLEAASQKLQQGK